MQRQSQEVSGGVRAGRKLKIILDIRLVTWYHVVATGKSSHLVILTYKEYIMGMGLVDDIEFDSQVENTNRPEITRAEIIDINKGRGEGNVEVPESLRKIIGETSITDGRQEALALAKSFGISESSVSAYANGANSTNKYNTGNEELRKHVKGAKQRIVSKSKRILNKALDNITDEKLEKAKLKDIATVVNAMTGVIERLDEKEESDRGNNAPQFIVYAPQIRQENNYPVINLNEG